MSQGDRLSERAAQKQNGKGIERRGKKILQPLKKTGMNYQLRVV
jgi:hypothetical protein